MNAMLTSYKTPERLAATKPQSPGTHRAVNASVPKPGRAYTVAQLRVTWEKAKPLESLSELMETLKTVAGAAERYKHSGLTMSLDWAGACLLEHR
jgi:hypothetical protein